MPKRPRSHSLEDESKNKLRLLLPERWVFRDKSHDYGIDCEVELFDEHAKTTGLLFYVQLKATDSKLSRVIHSVSIDTETIKYFYSLDVPVLIVRYSSHKDEFYVKWFSSIDLYYSKPDSKTTTIRFNEVDKWDDNTAATIENWLCMLRQLRNDHIRLPFRTSIIIDDKTTLYCPALLYMSQIKSEMSHFNDILSLQDNISESVVMVRIFDDELQVEIIGMGGIVSHYDKSQYSDLDGAKSIASLIIRSIGIWLILNVSPERGYKILTDNGLFRDTIDIPGLYAICLPKLMRSTIYISLLDEIYQSYQGSLSTDLMLSIPVILSESVVGDTRREEALAAFWKKTLVEVSMKCEDQEIGAFVYSLGNLLRSICKFREAFHYYWKAKKLVPEYLGRDYYYMEIAGVLFHLFRFKLSAKLYLQAYELGKDPKAIALHADALMYNGQYKEALCKFDDFLSICSKDDFSVTEWMLKRCCLDYMVNGCSISNQIRQPQLSQKYASDGNPNMDSLAKALDTDALCGLAWFKLGCLLKDESNWNNAAMCYLICGLLQPYDIETWIDTFFCSLNAKLPSEHLLLVISHAYKINRDSFLTELYQCLYASLEPELASKISSMIDTIINEVKIKLKQQESFIVRYDGEIIYSTNSYFLTNKKQ